MRIIVAGDGEVGIHLAKFLTEENHNITVIDSHSDLMKNLEDHYDLMTITGDPTSPAVLVEASVQKADLVMAVLHDEKINIITAILAKKLGAKKCIARVTNSEYLKKENIDLFRSLGIDALVCPERIATEEIIRLLNKSAATEAFDFSDGKLSLYLLKLDENALIYNKNLSQIAIENPHLNFRAVAIHRNSKTIIPKGNDEFFLNDLAYVITKPEGVNNLFKLGGKARIDIKNIMIVGGSRIGRTTAKILEHDYKIKLLDVDKKLCESLSDDLSKTLIINGDGRSVEILEDEGIKNVDAFIAVTDNSETNIFTCLMAMKYGVKKTIALVDDINYIDISHSIGIDTIINKKQITASYIVRFTMKAEVSSMKCLNGVDAEVLEFVVKAGSQITKKPLMEIRFPEGAIIGGVVRGKESYIAVGQLQIQEKDKVVVFAMPSAIHEVEKYFS